MSSYSHRATIVVPTSMIGAANHLACIMGESEADIRTFERADWIDANGNLFAVASAAVKPVFLAAATGVLPKSPEHAGAADRQLAQQVLNTLNQVGGIQMILGGDPMKVLIELGMLQVIEELDSI